MVDGCLLRLRGEDWGKKKPSENHVQWREMKLGVYFKNQEQTGFEKRRLLIEKRVVSTQGTAEELGRRLHWESQCHGLAKARRVRMVADGAAWIWNLAAQRWSQAEQVLDFYHASQHLHALAEAVYGSDSECGAHAARKWRHRLRKGPKDKLLKELALLKGSPGEPTEIIRREQAYLLSHQARMDYRLLAQSGPIGSGAVESACRNLQCRFKRTGQFWNSMGLRNLSALREARANHHWAQLWQSPLYPR